ncbi:MAG: DUF4178 domain-containing protein [Anaerolinea sp.]|nr:DUF4178 domain-containing protein [Anaerolinea sp.]
MIQSPSLQTPPVLKQLTCPSCGGSLPQYSPGAQTLICPRCNTYVKVEAEGLGIAGKGSKLPPPPAPVKLGQRFTLEGTGYFVLGRVLYEGWDDEDRWQWTEWLLGSNDGRLIWLSYDKEDGFVLFRKMRIREAFNPSSDRTIPTSDGKRAHVRERYPAKIIGAEGELTFRASAGDKLNMIEGAGFGKQYSIQQTLAELEVYEGNTLSSAMVAEALNDPAWAAQIKRSTNTKAVYQLVGVVAFVFAVIGGVLGVAASRTGDLALTQQLTLSTSAPTGIIPINFEVGDRPAVVRLRLNSGIPINTFVEVEASVISPDDTETFIFEKEFWYETGIDEGERWTESDTFGEEVFVPHQTGEHEIEIALGESSVTGNILVQVEVLRNHILPSYFLIYGVVVGIIGCCFLAMGWQRQK